MKSLAERKWFYPLIYFVFIVLAVWPPFTQVPYDPRHAQDVIMSILMISTQPYAAWGWVFHLATLGVIALAVVRLQVAGRVMAAYFGVNYLIIAVVQTRAVTEKYGLAVQIGALIAGGLLGLIWLWVAWKGKLAVSFQNVPAWRWFLFPLALLVFWSPIGLEGGKVVFNFNPLLLLTSPDYGLAYCFMSPVFLFLLIVCYPRVDGLAFRVTAFNALLYGLLNLIHWANPDRVVMGVMHLPLLLLALIALAMPRLASSSLAPSASRSTE